MPRPISVITRERFVTAMRSALPGAITRNGIRSVTGIHPRTLEKLLEEYMNRGLVERIGVKNNSEVFRWRGD